MNSCLYECEVMHERLEPKRNKFDYKIFMAYLDLDEIDQLTKKLWLLSRNSFNLFSFGDKHHAWFSKQKERRATVKENIVDFLSEKGINMKNGRIMLLTNFTTVGYVFNPVSFYFCFDNKGEAICAVSEVCNTFKEMKLYLLDVNTKDGERFRLTTPKNFYVSPFSDVETAFDFILKVPAEKLAIRVDDYKHNKRLLLSTLSGTQKALTDYNLLLMALRFPLVPFRIMFLIHWHALLLYFKKVPYFKKTDNGELQTETYQL